MRTYTRLQAEDLAGAVEKLPDLSPGQHVPLEDGWAREEPSPEGGVEDARLGHLVESWSQLPEHIRQAIMALLATTSGGENRSVE